MRYFIQLSYNGAAYCGWQRQPQPKAIAVQQVIEETLSKILRKETEVIGCGRTDAGVHASQFYLHFDTENELPKNFLQRMNKVLPADIAFYEVIAVENNAHTRFDANRRAYQYHIDFNKNPFHIDTIYHYGLAHKLDFDRMQEAASLLMNYGEFYTFCKSNTDVKTMKCEMFRSEWERKDNGLVFHVSANRFLRGMVRLIVGMCLNVGLGKLKIEQVKEALDKQERLTKSLSVPPHGLFLTEVHYPYISTKNSFFSKK